MSYVNTLPYENSINLPPPGLGVVPPTGPDAALMQRRCQPSMRRCYVDFSNSWL